MSFDNPRKQECPSRYARAFVNRKVSDYACTRRRILNIIRPAMVPSRIREFGSGTGLPTVIFTSSIPMVAGQSLNVMSQTPLALQKLSSCAAVRVPLLLNVPINWALFSSPDEHPLVSLDGEPFVPHGECEPVGGLGAPLDQSVAPPTPVASVISAQLDVVPQSILGKISVIETQAGYFSGSARKFELQIDVAGRRTLAVPNPVVVNDEPSVLVGERVEEVELVPELPGPTTWPSPV